MNATDLVKDRRLLVHLSIAVIVLTGIIGAGILFTSHEEASSSDLETPPELARIAVAPTPTVRPHTPTPVVTPVPPTEVPTPLATDPPVTDAPATDTPPAVTDPPVVYNPPPVPEPGDSSSLRVWSNGDSTSYFMSASFLQLMTARGATQVQPAPEYQISSGLNNTGFFDWPTYLSSQMVTYDPNVVVFMVGANDAHPGIDLEAYRSKVAAVMDQLAGRTLMWLGQPNMGPERPDLTAAIPGMNQVFAEEAGKRPWVRYLDTWSLTSDATGNYAEYLPDENGVLQQVRASDGVHFTPEGGRRLALAVIAALP